MNNGFPQAQGLNGFHSTTVEDFDHTQPLPGRAALIVIDITKDSLLPPEISGIDLIGAPAAVANSRQVIAAARAVSLPVIFIQERHRRDLVDFGRELDGAEGVHCLEGEPGAEFLDDLRPLPHEYYVPKRRYSAFFGTDLEILLKGLKVDTLILIGFLTDVCVHYTGVDAHQHDYRIRVVRDCVAGSSLAAHKASLNALEYLQSGAVVSLETMLDAITALQSQKVAA
ncbi:MAG: cysteine hydrolase [Abitibacteriaceae bacterium]|nr:cysteine hydrolase [Abditibacteriaceae bacterium]MBV9868916.1 cysteine hydrolase [Abditibacteriaceae bacterium]